jgi:hypothetical protein
MTAPDGDGIGDGGADKILAMGMNLDRRYRAPRCTACNTGPMWALEKCGSGSTCAIGRRGLHDKTDSGSENRGPSRNAAGRAGGTRLERI